MAFNPLFLLLNTENYPLTCLCQCVGSLCVLFAARICLRIFPIINLYPFENPRIILLSRLFACLLLHCILFQNQMNRLVGLLAVVCTVLVVAPTAVVGQRLIISEYLHNTGQNAIELYNPSCWSIDLTKYQLRIAIGGAAWTTSIPLTTTIAARSQRTFCSSAFVGACTSTPALSFTGRDAIGLFHNNVLIDVIGAPYTYVNSGWDVAGIKNATSFHTMIRKPAILSPVAQWLVPTRYVPLPLLSECSE